MWFLVKGLFQVLRILEIVKKIIEADESNALNAMIGEMNWSEEILWSEILILKSYVAIFTMFTQSSDFLGSEKNTTIALVTLSSMFLGKL